MGRRSTVGKTVIVWVFLCAWNVFVTDVKGEYYGDICKNDSECRKGFVCKLGICQCEDGFFYTGPRGCKKVCNGTNWAKTSYPRNTDFYAFYKQRYTGCEYVEGNLEIVRLKENYDLDFLKDIEEVTGYVLVKRVLVDYLNLTKLTVVWGTNTLRPLNSDISIFFPENHENSKGLKELQLKSLREVRGGGAYFRWSKHLCGMRTINWDDVTFGHIQYDVYTGRNCTPCHKSCWNKAIDKTYCWGSGEDMCQSLSLIKGVCPDNCHGRCFGDEEKQCCSAKCVAGCSGSLDHDCFRCESLIDNGKCVDSCPPLFIYDYKKSRTLENPDGKYLLGSTCVQKCPDDHVANDGICLKQCPGSKFPDPITSICEPCLGVCPGIRHQKCPGVSQGHFIDSENLNTFRNCTVVLGNLVIRRNSFKGNPDKNITGLRADDLNILKTIEHVKGFVSIQETPTSLTDLSFLSGLKTIRGMELSVSGSSFIVTSSWLKRLDLNSLGVIERGDINIKNNKQLCHLDNVNFKLLRRNANQNVNISETNENCDNVKFECHRDCLDGCWGPTQEDCVTIREACKKYNRTEYLFDIRNNCRTVHKVTAEYCMGTCGHKSGSSSYITLEKSPKSTKLDMDCRCCMAIPSYELTGVPVICGSSKYQSEGHIRRIDRCECHPCLPGIPTVRPNN